MHTMQGQQPRLWKTEEGKKMKSVIMVARDEHFIGK